MLMLVLLWLLFSINDLKLLVPSGGSHSQAVNLCFIIKGNV